MIQQPRPAGQARSPVVQAPISEAEVVAIVRRDAAALTHADTHENGGSDELDVTGLSGVLADPQTPATHTQAATSVTVSSGAWAGSLAGAGTSEVQATLDWIDANLSGGGGGLDDFAVRARVSLRI